MAAHKRPPKERRSTTLFGPTLPLSQANHVPKAASLAAGAEGRRLASCKRPTPMDARGISSTLSSTLRRRKGWLIAVASAVLVAILVSCCGSVANLVPGYYKPTLVEYQYSLVNELKVPSGFGVTVFRAELGRVRMLAAGNGASLLATRPDQGEVILLRDSDGDGVAEALRVLVFDLDGVHGIARHSSTVWLATSRELWRAS